MPIPSPVVSLLALAALAAPAARAASVATITALTLVPGPGAGSLDISATIRNTGPKSPRCALTLAVGNRRTTMVVTLLPAPGDGSSTRIEARLTLPEVRAWSPDRPALYLLNATLESGGRTVDRRAVPFGLRTHAWRDGRLTLNGMPWPVRGAVPAAGAGIADLAALQRAGYNLVRLPTDPAAAALRDWCDHHGLLALGDGTEPDSAQHPAEVGPGAPALVPLDGPEGVAPGAAVPPGWETDFDRLGLAREFLSATGLVEAARAFQTVALRAAVEEELTAADPRAWLTGRPAEPALTALLPRPDAPWHLAIRPRAALIEPGDALEATVFATGTASLPAGTTLDWRVLAPGEDPGLPPPWRTGPPPTGNAWLLPAFLPPVEGRWQLAARLRRGTKVLAMAEEPFWCAPASGSSQVSFALAGDLPSIREAFGAWVIPAEFSRIIFIGPPSLLASSDLARCVRDAAAGKTVIIAAPVEAADLAALHRLPEFPGGLELAPATAGPRLPLVRAGRFGSRLPGAGPQEPWGFFAGGPVSVFAPRTALTAPAGATVYAGSVDAAAATGQAGATDLGYAAEVLAVPVGTGRMVFCQWTLADHLDRPLARLLVLRLLGL